MNACGEGREGGMRIVVQRVREAAVRVGGEEIARIGHGLVALVAVHRRDQRGDLEWSARKLAELRIFDDADGKLNLGLGEVGGEILVVSQFTLYGDCRKGRRPSYVDAAAPETARARYAEFVELLRAHAPVVRDGRFQADMDVSLVNTGPVTLILDSPGASEPSS
jgi:D-tyrosyl-tRNA(Tyr) deacylase